MSQKSNLLTQCFQTLSVTQIVTDRVCHNSPASPGPQGGFVPKTAFHKILRVDIHPTGMTGR